MPSETLTKSLGCPTTTRVLVMRKKLDISTKFRILRFLPGDLVNAVSTTLLENTRGDTGESKWI